jgi:hypothetical protein
MSDNMEDLRKKVGKYQTQLTTLLNYEENTIWYQMKKNSQTKLVFNIM